MLNLLDNIYEIKNIMVVKFKEDYSNYLDSEVIEKLNNIKYFNNTYYFLNHEVIENGHDTYLEIFEDAIIGTKLFERVITTNNNSLPDFIEEVQDFKFQGLTNEEIEKGLVTSSKLFYSFQIINQEEKKVKKYGIRRVG